MAKKKVVRVSKLASALEQLKALRVAIETYVSRLRYRQADLFQITLQAKTQDGKEGMFNVASLLASVLTAQGLGKEVRLVAEANPQGGTLYVRFYSPVSTDSLRG